MPTQHVIILNLTEAYNIESVDFFIHAEESKDLMSSNGGDHSKSTMRLNFFYILKFHTCNNPMVIWPLPAPSRRHRRIPCYNNSPTGNKQRNGKYVIQSVAQYCKTN